MNDPNINGEGPISSTAESKGRSETGPVLDQEIGLVDRAETVLGVEVKPAGDESLPLRRVSTRFPVSRSAKPLGAITLDSKSGVRRPVRDRWEYVPVIPPIHEQHGSSGVGDTHMLVAPVHETILGPVGGINHPVRLTPSLRHSDAEVQDERTSS